MGDSIRDFRAVVGGIADNILWQIFERFAVQKLLARMQTMAQSCWRGPYYWTFLKNARIVQSTRLSSCKDLAEIKHNFSFKSTILGDFIENQSQNPGRSLQDDSVINLEFVRFLKMSSSMGEGTNNDPTGFR